MTTSILPEGYDIDNPCGSLLLMLTEHLTNPTREYELIIFDLMAKCANSEPATVATAATVLTIMADKVTL